MSPDIAIGKYLHVPRRVRVKPLITFIRAFLWICLLLVLTIGPYLSYRSWVRLRLLADSGTQINARILSSYMSGGKGASYVLVLQFDGGSLVVNEQKTVSQTLYAEYAGAPTVPVTVSPSDPYDFEVGPVDDAFISRRLYIWIGLIVFGVVYAGAFVFGLERVILIEGRLMAFGQPVVGEALEAEPLKDKQTTLRLKYRYETQFGERTGKVVGNGRLADFTPGSKVLILYGKDDDRKSKPASMFYFTEIIWD